MRYLIVATMIVLLGACTKDQNKTHQVTKSKKATPQLVDGQFTQQEFHQLAAMSLEPKPAQDETNKYVGNKAAAHFGQFLFFDNRLSANNQVSCATCHQPDHGFSTTERHASGIHKTKRHPPALINIAHSPWFDWDGKANTLWGQAMRPLESPDEHGLTRVSLAQIIAKQPDLNKAYSKIFGPLPKDILNTKRFNPIAMPQPGTPESKHHKAWLAMTVENRHTINTIASNVTKAIAAYQHKIVDYNAPFDRYARALIAAKPEASSMLPVEAKRGFKLFVGKALCSNCHNGPNFTDDTFHNLGLEPPESYVKGDKGRLPGITELKNHEFNALGPYSDNTKGDRAQWLTFLTTTRENKGQFKTPTLRNITITFPYMHGGHFEGIRQVINFYNELPDKPETGHREEMLVPLGLSDPEIDDLIAFLRTLTTDKMDPILFKPPTKPYLE